jgi:enoyl-CoA hydratase/carnithine racemase
VNGAGSRAEVVQLDRDDGVAIVHLNRPRRANAVDAELATQLVTRITGISGDPDIRALVLAGRGPSFCGGADLRTLDRDLGPGGVHPLLDVVRAVSDCPLPTVAAITGPARGGGVELALACDVRVLDTEATLGLPEVELGGLPGAGGLALLPRTVGLATALDLVLGARVLDAAESLSLGLVDRVSRPGRALEEAVGLARRIASAPRELILIATGELRAACGVSASATVVAATATLVARLQAFGPAAAPPHETPAGTQRKAIK